MDHGYLYDLLREWGLTDFGASSVEFLLLTPLKIGAILLGAMLLGRVAKAAAKRSVRTVGRRHAHLRLLSPQRAEQRAVTVGEAVGKVAQVAVLAVGGMMAIAELGLNLGPLVAGAGLAGVAIGFGMRDVVADLAAGLCILLEDQYGVGDVVNIGGTVGTVEDLSLRATRIRGVDGTVWFIANGEIRKSGNATMEWSMALVDVGVTYDVDLDEAARVVTVAAAEFALEEPGLVVEPPKVRRLQAMSELRQTIRVVVKSPPRSQYDAADELRLRLMDALRAAGIDRARVTSGQLDIGTPPPAPLEAV
jgi:moderate conductance mechanosensitive channel